MNMLYSSDRSLVVLRSTILGSCANESPALCNNHTEIIIKNCDFVVLLFGCEKMNTEQRINLKFLVRFGETLTEALKLFPVYGAVKISDV